MEQTETTEQPTVALTEVSRWSSAITALEAKGAALAQRRTDLEREQRRLLAEQATGSDVDARVRALRAELGRERAGERRGTSRPPRGRTAPGGGQTSSQSGRDRRHDRHAERVAEGARPAHCPCPRW